MKGFTVIEIMIVIAIIAIIAAITIPNFFGEETYEQWVAEQNAKREASCPFHECREIWFKNYRRNGQMSPKWCWEISSSEDMVSDTLRHVTETDVLAVAAAREKRGFTLVSRNGNDPSYVNLMWRSP